MSVAYMVRNQCRKLVNLGGSIFRRDFNSSKCKTWARMTTARIKLLRNKREAVVRQMRRDIALLLQSGQDSTARIRVEHVIREQNMMAANEILELFCERIVARLSIIAKQRGCPSDLKEAISSLVFAGPRCSDIPELLAIRDIFQKKYGKDFVSAATDLRPDSGVNRLLIEKLSALNPPGELKLKVMKEIAKEYEVEWDTTETELELLKPPEERIEGPRTFVSAASLPLKHGTTSAHKPTTRLNDIPGGGGGGGGGEMNFQDPASAAKAAADSAKSAIAAAQAAAHLVARTQTPTPTRDSCDCNQNNFNALPQSSNLAPHIEDNLGVHGIERCYRSQSLGTAAHNNNAEMSPNDMDDDFNTRRRRHSYNNVHGRHAHTHNNNNNNNNNNNSNNTDIIFDESDCDQETEMEPQPPPYPPPPSNAKHSVHPKLPDYDALTARFESLKYRNA